MTGVPRSELLLKRKPRTKFSILLPNMEEHIQNQQGRQQRQDKRHVKLREMPPRDSVNVRNTRGGMEKWVPGTVIRRRLGSLTYLVRVGRQLRYVHVDHLLQTERVNCEETFEESSVLVSGSSTPPTVSESSTPLPANVSVSKTPKD